MNKLSQINNASDLKTMFEQIVEEHPLLKGFAYGTYAELVAMSRSSLQYPCLMYELPDESYKDNRADYRRRYFECAIVILNNGAKTKEKKIESLDLAATILKHIVARLDDESKKTFHFHFRIADGDAGNAQIVSTLTADMDIGRRVELRIGEQEGLVHDENNWE